MRHSYPHVQVCEARLRAAKVTVSPSNIGRPHVDRLWLLDTGRYNHGTVRQVLAGQLEATTGRSGSVHQIDFKCCKICEQINILLFILLVHGQPLSIVQFRREK